MNYIELINNFWTCDEIYSFGAKETRLYFYLLKVANSLHWQEYFWHSDSKTAGNVGFTVNTLKSARNSLKNAGLIEFKTGGNGYGDKSRYQILIPKLQPKVEPTFTPRLEPKLQPKVEPLNKLKQKPNKKENNTSKSHSENEFSVIEKIENLKVEKPPENSFFKNFTRIWFTFHQEKYTFKPNFKSVDGVKINSIISKLKKIAEEKNFEFTEEIAEQSFLKFLNLAYADDWLKSNFQLQILDSKFDSIIQKKINNDKGISNNKQQGNSAMAAYKEQLLNDLQGT